MTQKIGDTMRAYKLCLSGGCPEMTIIGDEYIIRDDYGGEVRLPKEAVERLREILEELDNPAIQFNLPGE